MTMAADAEVGISGHGQARQDAGRYGFAVSKGWNDSLV